MSFWHLIMLESSLPMEPAKILVVDDEKSILLLLKEALTQWGYQVTTAPSAVEGLELLKNGLFDAIISDIRMPDMTGLDLLREIRKQDETIEVVMMTGYPTIASAVQALKEGAYSGAVADALGLFRGADEGTIFLDEIAELSPSLQVKLLRVLQEMQVRPVGSTKAFPVDVRVIAATNRDLERAMTEGSFRQDLFYRLNVVRVLLPPLRERRDDIPALVTHFLRRFNRRFHRDVRGMAPDALATLSAYSFPGNVRELENLIERAYAMGAREQITLADLPTLGRTPLVAPTATANSQTVPTLA